MTLAENRRLRFVFLCVMYVAQGLPYGFVTITLKNWVTDEGVTAGEWGTLASLISIPWIFKFAWGPVVDRFGIPAMGRRRPWIIAAQLLMMISVAEFLLIPDLAEDLRILGWVILGHNVFVSLQDVSVDALAVDLVPKKELGVANGFMFGSNYLGGYLIGGFAIGAVLDAAGMTAALLSLMGIQCVILCLPILIRERKGEKLLPWSPGRVHAEVEERRAHSLGELFGNLARAFRLRSNWVLGIFCVGMLYASTALGILATPFFQHEMGWGETKYRNLESAWLGWMSFGGCVIGGFIVRWIGVRRSVVFWCAAWGISYMVFASLRPHWEADWIIYVSFCAHSFLRGLVTVSVFSLCMTVAWSRVGGSHYTAYMALQNVSIFLGSLTVFLYEDTPIEHAYAILGAFQFALCFLVWFLVDPDQTRRELGE